MTDAYTAAHSRIAREVLARHGKHDVSELPESVRVRLSMLASLIIAADTNSATQQVGRRIDINEALKIADGIASLMEALDIGKAPPTRPMRIQIVDGPGDDVPPGDLGLTAGDVSAIFGPVLNVTRDDLALAVGPPEPAGE
jgi:hypothetical protein